MLRQLRDGYVQRPESSPTTSCCEELILNRVTHLDQLADKLKEERVRRVIEPLLSGAGEHGFQAPDVEYVRDLGLIARDDPPRMANPIYGRGRPARADLRGLIIVWGM